MPEIHLFILWEKVGVSQGAVLDRIGSEFEVLRVFHIKWSRSLFSHNLSRFYGEKLPPGCNKEASCGVGPFMLVVVRDVRPKYLERDTTRGRARVNTRIFDLKAFYRSSAGGSLHIHATNTLSETSHDLALLLGLDLDQFVKVYPGPWDGEVVQLKRDVVGAKGWNTIEELFTILNATLNYVVLRNFECLPKQYHLDEHGDIDLLVGSYSEACFILNSVPVFNEPYRVHHTVIIGGQPVPFDFRYVGDGYYHECWQRHILESRVLADGGFYIPDADNHFYSLLYHAVVHKRCLGSAYKARLTDLSSALDAKLDLDKVFSHPRQTRKFLLRYLKRHGYKFTRPLDATVYFNASVALNPISRVFSQVLSLQPKRLRVFSSNKTADTGEIPYLAYHIPLRSSQHQDVSNHSLQLQSLVCNEECESYLLSILKAAKDVSSSSSEILKAIRDWSSEYHLSPVRHNLLRPFEFKATERILELGCGCGSITRYLGETGAAVVAVEGSLRRAEIAAERCRDLPNVTVYNFSNFMDENKFDYVTLIGVLEYSPLFVSGDDPVVASLMKARSHLKEDGALILAIENQLGLKYFNGCSEDHIGIPYFGINGLYSKGDPTTFGRHKLIEKLKEAGFPKVEFFFPFPDYKLPGLILSEAALEDGRLKVADLLMHNAGRDYQGNHYRAFSESSAWRVVEENNLTADLANSFLIFARQDQSTRPPISWLAKIFSRGRRNFCYQIDTTISSAENAELVVRKKKIYPDAVASDQYFFHVVSDDIYLIGNLLVGKIHSAMAKEADLDELASCFSPWLNFLLANAVPSDEGIEVLPSNFVDCIPGNLIEDSAGALHYFDAEWVSAKPIPMVWTIIRGIIYSLMGCLENRTIKCLTLRQLIMLIAQRAGICLIDADFRVAHELEDRLVSQCHVESSIKATFSELFDEELILTCRLVSNIPELRRELEWSKAELARVKSTFSWRITVPLRVIKNVSGRLVERFRGV